MDKIKRLQELYIEFNKLKFSGEDVVSEIRAEINDIELQILKEEIFPKAMEELANRLSVMRCTIDFSFQYDGKGTIDYSFCKSDYYVASYAVCHCLCAAAWPWSA